MKTSMTSMLCFAAALLALDSCSSSPTPPAQPTPEGVEVTLMIYSGRVNPSFILDQAAVTRVGELLRAAQPNPAFQGTSVIPSVLGYQGIMIVDLTGASGLPGTIALRNEDIEVQGVEARFLRDRGATLERFLLDQAVAQKAIGPETRALIRR